jgi:hypothetical protein
MEKQKLPNGMAVLILGILSIPTCCCYGVLGLILAIIALVLAKKDTALYKLNPELYSNYSNISTGKILAYIGIALNVIYLLITIWAIATFGMEGMQDPQIMQEKIRELLG